MSLAEKYVYFKNIYGFGEGQLGFIKGLLNVQGALIIMNFIKLYFPSWAPTAMSLLPVFILSYIIVGFSIGIVLDKRVHMMHKERAFGNVRDPAILDIQERLRRIENKM